MSDSAASPSDVRPPPPSRPRRRGALYVGVAAAVVIVLVAGGVALAGGDDDSGGGTCVSGLLGHLPAELDYVDGADLAAARAAGYDDGDLDAIYESSSELGISPDPLTRWVVQRTGTAGDLPYEPAGVTCWAGRGGPDEGFALRGEFDEEAVEATGLGDLEVDGDLLVRRDDADGGGAPPVALEQAVDALGRNDVLGFHLVNLGREGDPDGPWSGIALAHGDSWDLVVVWSYADDDTAAGAEDRVGDVLAEDSGIPDMIDGDAGDALERDGSVLVLRAPLAGDPATWLAPINDFDGALVAGAADD